jgi:hypothetical protein
MQAIAALPIQIAAPLLELMRERAKYVPLDNTVEAPIW